MPKDYIGLKQGGTQGILVKILIKITKPFGKYTPKNIWVDSWLNCGWLANTKLYKKKYRKAENVQHSVCFINVKVPYPNLTPICPLVVFFSFNYGICKNRNLKSQLTSFIFYQVVHGYCWGNTYFLLF